MRCSLIAGVLLSCCHAATAAYDTTLIDNQVGTPIHCAGSTFVYTYNPRAQGPDATPTITGDAGFMDEYGGVYASFFGDVTTDGDPVSITYTLVAEGNQQFGTVSVSSRAAIFHSSGTITAEYRVDGGDWTSIFNYVENGDYRSVDELIDVGGSTLELRYRMARTTGTYSPYSDQLQLFRSSGLQIGEEGDFTFRIEGTLTPEPGSATALALLGAFALCRGRRR
jgi:hypothetical protein